MTTHPLGAGRHGRLPPTGAPAVPRRTAPQLSGTLEGESGLNDPSAVLAVTLLSDIGHHPPSPALIAGEIVHQLAAGAAIGVLAGVLGAQALRRVALPTSGLYPIAILALIVASYGAATAPVIRARPPPAPPAWEALEQAIIGKAVDLVSGPGGLASFLRRRQLGARLAGPSLPLDVGVSKDIPAAIRHAVIVRDQHCRWTGRCFL